MQKTYIVRLTDDERASCLAVVKKLKGSSQKVRRANILLKSDIDGPNWTDQDIADAFFCSRQPCENSNCPSQQYLPFEASGQVAASHIPKIIRH